MWTFDNDLFKISILRNIITPDMSVLDLCLNWSLEKRADHFKIGARIPADLIGALREAKDSYDLETLDRAWECLISTYQKILNCSGGNQLRAPFNGVNRSQMQDVNVFDVPIDMVPVDGLQVIVDAYFLANP